MRSILITGGNGGLGVAIARAFLSGSATDRVWLGVRARRDAVGPMMKEFPGRCETVSLEVTDRTDWDSAVGQIVAATGRLDILVNNAGTHQDALLATMAPSTWERVCRVNLDGVFHGCQAVLPTMIGQRSGRIINIASLSALLAPAGQANYAAAKAGVVALTQSLAKEVARLQITVNAVCPGYIDTEALSGLPPEKRQMALAQVPMRRFGRPAEVAAVVHFLAGEAAGYVTGATIKVDGGIL